MMWIIPARVDGTWKPPDGDMTLTQTFQMVSGALRRASRTPIAGGRLRGDQLTFTVGPAVPAAQRHAIEGTVATRRPRMDGPT